MRLSRVVATRGTATRPIISDDPRSLLGRAPPDTSAPVIVTQKLTKRYPGADFLAVDQLDLTVNTGEIFGLLGPNGAGKTTTAGMLTTRVVPTSGSATVAGVNVVEHPALAKQFLGVVSQTNTLDRQLTVRENLYFHGRLFGTGATQSRTTASELPERSQPAEWATASVYALSGGMAQRLMVARSIFHRPAVLFMDEPTAGLDPQSRLVLGTSFEPRNIGLMFGFIILPITFLGGTYYQWTQLAPVKIGPSHWLQAIVLVNPLLYVNEGMRAAFTDVPHIHLYVIYPVLVAFCASFLALGLRNFRRRVLS
jgi:ABC-type Na+ transport system ATPase subunit NatA